MFPDGVPALTPLVVTDEEPAPAEEAASGGTTSTGGTTPDDDAAQTQGSGSGQPATTEQRPVRVIGNTGGIGVSHRNDCADGARLPGFGWADGEEVEVVATGDGRCARWLRVRAGDGVTSWVREQYLLPA